jgi:hypothetical protein
MDDGHAKFTGLLGACSWKAIADIVIHCQIQGHATGGDFLRKEHWRGEEKRGKEDEVNDIVRASENARRIGLMLQKARRR